MQVEIDELKQRPAHRNNVNSLIQEVGQLKQSVDHHSIAIDTLKRNISDIRISIAFDDDLLDEIDEYQRKVREVKKINVRLVWPK